LVTAAISYALEDFDYNVDDYNVEPEG